MNKQANTNQEAHLNIDHLRSMVNILQHQSETTQAFLDHALNEAIRITNSKIGYIYHYDERRKEFVLNTWSKDVMRECTITDPQTCYELDKTGIWGEAVRQRRPIIVNDFAKEHPLKKGYPEGHASLLKYMTIPVFIGDQIVGAAGVANKETDYTELDVLQLQLLMDAVWKVVDLRKTIEREDHLRKVLMGIRNVNQLITQESDPDKLIGKACDELTATLGYHTAWIALMDEGKKVLRVATSNLNSRKEVFEKYLNDGNLPLCVEQALAREGVVNMDNPAATCSECPVFQEYGIENGLSTRISYGDKLYGVIAVSVPAEYAALDEEHSLLLEVAGDLGFALHKIELENLHQLSVEKIKNSDRIFNHAMDMLCIAGFDGYFKVLNPSWSKVLGWSEEEMLAKPWIEFVYPDDREATLTAGSTLVDGKEVYQFENRYLCKDGSVKWLSWNSYPYPGENIMYGVARDITERKATEDNIKNSEAFVRAVIDNLPVGVAVNSVDPQVNFSYMNDNFSRIYRTTKEDLMKPGNFWEAVYHDPEFREKIRDKVLKDCLDGNPDNMIWEDIPIVREGEKTTYISARNTPVPGKPLMISTVWDVTDKKLNEEIIRENEARFRQFVESAPVGIIISDQAQNTLYASKRFTELYGYTTEDMPTVEHWWPLAYPDEGQRSRIRSFWNQKVQEARENQSVVEPMEYPVRCKDGSVRHTEFRLAVNGENNLIVMTDVTERVKMRDDLMESRQMLRTILDTIPVRVFWKDKESKYLGCNLPFAMDAGMDNPEELIGKTDFEMGWKGQAELYRADDRDVMESGIPKLNYEEPQTSPKGETIYLKTSKIPLRNLQGEIIGVMGTYDDITESKLSADALRNREQVLQKIFEILPIGLWFADEKGNLIRGNPAGIKIWGAEPKVGPEDYGVFKARRLPSGEEVGPDEWALARTIRDGVTVEDELLEIDGFDGKKKVILNYTAPILDDNNKISGALVLNRDITERYRSDLIQHIQYTIAQTMVSCESLVELYDVTRRELNALFDTSNFLVAFYDEQSGMLSSPFDMTDEETIPTWPAEKSLTGMVIKKARSLLLTKEQIGKMAEAGEINLHGQRAEIWMGVPLRIGNVLSGAIVVQSFTDPNAYNQSSLQVLEIIASQLSVYIEHKRAEEALRSSEETFRLIAENTADNITVMDLNLNITYTSPSILNIRGYTPEEAMKHSVEEIFTPSSLAKVQESFVKHMELEMSGVSDPGRTLKMELEEYHKDGSTIWVESTISLLRDTKNNAIGIVAVSRDISLRKKAEDALIEAKEKAEASDRLKTAFMNNISHEIRTPLNGILGFGQMMAYSHLTEKERLEYLSILQQSTDRLIHTITDYMDISLIASDNLQLNLAEFDLNDFMASVFNHMQSACLTKNLDLQLNLPENGLKLSFFSDKEMLQKVIHHLMNNAIKFTHQGSISCGYRCLGDTIEFFVKDTGVGIAKDALERIFEAFGQEETGTSRSHEGSGLGLSISRGIIRKLGGEISIQTEKGKGTEVICSLPFRGRELKPAVTQTDAGSITIPENPLILVAEDDESNYLYIEVVLKKSGYRFLHVEDGKSAVDLCRKQPEIDLVLMDVKMPVMDGLEATRQIKAFRKDLPVVAITAYALSGDEHRIRQAGCDDYIAKPVRQEVLSSVISKNLTKKVL